MGLTEKVVGTWHVVLWSNNFFITVLSDLDVQIDKLGANQPLADQKTLYEWLRDPPDLRCPQLTVLSPDNSTKFEFAYTVEPGTKAKSIINTWQTHPDGTIKWILTPQLSAHICPTIVEAELVVLRQIDSFPQCDNIIVLLRGDLSPVRVDAVRDYLESTRSSLSMNGLLRTQCDVM
uniref:Lipocln_cytosolic_FA-bd_dom domain-containing protein n=1 Tax=Panagrellus redivivus TaxID=6233 RepID=A0A7E4VJU0_PANRE